MSYGNSWQYGDKVKIVHREWEDKDCGIRYNSSREHPELIGHEGKVIEIHDGGYDSPNPTGYERVTLVVEFGHLRFARDVDSAYCEKVES